MNRAFGLKAIPNVFLIDEAGIIRLINPKEKDKAVEKLFLAEGIRTEGGAVYETTGLEDAVALAARVGASPDDVALRLRLAALCSMNGDFDQARPHYEQVLVQDPGNAGALFGLGIGRLERGDKPGAVEAWRQALARDKWNWVIRKQIWAVEHPENFYEGAIDYAWQKEQTAREGDLD